MERYFEGDEFSEDEIRQALRVNVGDGSIVPVLMGSNTMARGMYTLMADIVKYLPSPDKRKVAGINTVNNEVFNADYDFAKAKSAYVFNPQSSPASRSPGSGTPRFSGTTSSEHLLPS